MTDAAAPARSPARAATSSDEGEDEHHDGAAREERRDGDENDEDDDDWQKDEDVGAGSAAGAAADGGADADSSASLARAARRAARKARAAAARETKRHALYKKLLFMTQLMKHLDSLVFAEICTLYYMDCSLFPLLLRCAAQGFFMSPKSDDLDLLLFSTSSALLRGPYLGAILVPNALSLLLHLFSSLPRAPESARGYLHGGVVVDVIGQSAPTSRWPLVLLDLAIAAIQCLMLAVHADREVLREYVRSPAAARLAAAVAEELGGDATAATTTMAAAAAEGGAGDGNGTTGQGGGAVDEVRATADARRRPRDSADLDREERGEAHPGLTLRGVDGGGQDIELEEFAPSAGARDGGGAVAAAAAAAGNGHGHHRRQHHRRDRRRRRRRRAGEEDEEGEREGEEDDEEDGEGASDDDDAAAADDDGNRRPLMAAEVDASTSAYRASALDVLYSGNAVVGEFHVVDALRTFGRRRDRTAREAAAQSLQNLGYVSAMAAIFLERQAQRAEMARR